MKHKLLTRLALMALMTLSPLSASAQQVLQEWGEIIEIRNSMINVNDLAFPMLPTVKVFMVNGKKGGVSDLKPGDYAKVSVIRLGKKDYVDTIQLVKELPKPLTNLQESLNVYKQGLHTN